MKYAIGATAKFKDGSGGYLLEDDSGGFFGGTALLYDTREQAEADIARRRANLNPTKLPAGMVCADWIVIECPNDVAPDELGLMQ